MTSDKNKMYKLTLKNTKGEVIELIVKDTKRSNELKKLIKDGYRIQRRQVMIISEENLNF